MPHNAKQSFFNFFYMSINTICIVCGFYFSIHKQISIDIAHTSVVTWNIIDYASKKFSSSSLLRVAKADRYPLFQLQNQLNKNLKIAGIGTKAKHK